MGFFRTRTAYKQGFGGQLGKFWPGNDNIHALTAPGQGHSGGSVVGGLQPTAPDLSPGPCGAEDLAPARSPLTAGRLCLSQPGVHFSWKTPSGLRTSQTSDPDPRLPESESGAGELSEGRRLLVSGPVRP